MEYNTYKYTVYAKECSKRYAADRGVQVEHYYFNNGIFADNKFIKNCESRGQTISYSGVNSHFQNGRSKN